MPLSRTCSLKAQAGNSPRKDFQGYYKSASNWGFQTLNCISEKVKLCLPIITRSGGDPQVGIIYIIKYVTKPQLERYFFICARTFPGNGSDQKKDRQNVKIGDKIINTINAVPTLLMFVFYGLDFRFARTGNLPILLYLSDLLMIVAGSMLFVFFRMGHGILQDYELVLKEAFEFFEK